MIGLILTLLVLTVINAVIAINRDERGEDASLNIVSFGCTFVAMVWLILDSMPY